MLSSISSYLLTLNGQAHTFNVADNRLVLHSNPPITWTAASDIASVCNVYNTSKYFYVKLRNETGHVFSLGTSSLKEIAKFSSFCPVAVYGVSEYLVCNENNSCRMVNVKTNKQSVKLNHRILGYDSRTQAHIFKLLDDSFMSFSSGKFHHYDNPSLDSVSSLPIVWFIVLPTGPLVLGTTFRRVMYVQDGVITSNFRLPHHIEHITPETDVSVAVSGGCGKTALAVPVLGLCREEEEGRSGAMAQLEASCDNQITKELKELNRLREHCQKKTQFLVEAWNKLFDQFQSEPEQEQDQLMDYKSKRRKQDSTDSHKMRKQDSTDSPKRRKQDSTDSPDREFCKDLPFQIPIRPKLYARTSVILGEDGHLTIFCSYPEQPLYRSTGRVQDSARSLQSLTESHYRVAVGPEFVQRIGKMFRFYLVSQPSSLVLDNLAHLITLMSIADE